MTTLRQHFRSPLFTALVCVLMLQTMASYAACDLGNADVAATATVPCHGDADVSTAQDIDTCCAACFSAAPTPDVPSVAHQLPQPVATPRVTPHATLIPNTLFRPPISHHS